MTEACGPIHEKSCTRCCLVKSLREFNCHPLGAGGRDTRCKQCISEVRKERRAEDPEKERNRVREWRSDTANRSKELAAARDRRRDDVEKARAMDRELYHSKVEHMRAYQRARYWSDPAAARARSQRTRQVPSIKAKLTESQRRYKRDNKIRIAATDAAWRAANKEKILSGNNIYRGDARARGRERYDDPEVAAVYREAAALARETGVKREVDHILPIKHPKVCGLHVAANLQILLPSENRRKSNKIPSSLAHLFEGLSASQIFLEGDR